MSLDSLHLFYDKMLNSGLPVDEPERRLPARRGSITILERAVPEAGAPIEVSLPAGANLEREK